MLTYLKVYFKTFFFGEGPELGPKSKLETSILRPLKTKKRVYFNTFK